MIITAKILRQTADSPSIYDQHEAGKKYVEFVETWEKLGEMVDGVLPKRLIKRKVSGNVYRLTEIVTPERAADEGRTLSDEYDQVILTPQDFTYLCLTAVSPQETQ